MKKVLVLCVLACMALAVSAQQVPNGSFYYWNNILAPNGWGTWASAISNANPALADTAAKLAQRDTTADYYPSDTATLRLTVDTLRLPGYGRVTLSGFAALGGASYTAPPTGVGLRMGYMPYKIKPDTLYFDYKMIAAAGAHDTPMVSIGLTHWDTLSRSRFELLSEAFVLAPDSQWQYNVAIPLIDYYDLGYPDSIYPDSLQIIFFASSAAHPTIGTTLWLDSVRFDASVIPTATGVADLSTIHGVAIWPNPAQEQLYIGLDESEVNSTLEIYDASGRRVYQGRLPDRVNTISAEALAPGIYSLRIHSRDGITTYRSQITIAR